jgi:hypothetical protein
LSQSRKQKIREDLQKQRRRRRTLTTTALVAVVMIAVVIIIILLQRPTPPPGSLGSPISQSLYSEMSGVSDATLNGSINATGVTGLISANGNALTSGGKPELLYIGAEFCPFCAAERWSMVVALARFGTFTGLTYMLSSDADVYPNTPTFSFRQASYTSNYLSFVSVETQDRSRQPLQSPTSDQQAVMNQWDSSGTIPFLDIGDGSAKQYLINMQSHSGSQFVPSVLSGLNWTQVGMQLDSPLSSVAKSVDGAADTIISAICSLDGGAPANVCGNQYAKIIQAPLSLGQMPLLDPLVRFLASDREVPVSWKGLQQSI